MTQIWMNDIQCKEINELCKQNAYKSKKFKHFTKKHIESSVGMDWLCWAPVSVAYVPRNEIWIWDEQHYKVAMDEFRLWYKENKES